MTRRTPANPTSHPPPAETTTRLRSLLVAMDSLDSVDARRRFFEDLCTPAELAAMADRWLVAKLLDEGVAYRDIYEQTGVSTATVTRVARALTQGAGGYRAALDASPRAGARKRGARA